ncbi:MAG TPA: nitrite reductase [Deltaproteobacteria bacterium]|nr:MAG: nitrite reductase [Deltaproteobacteria bacterium GWA2_55_82]OGQ63959.1 MAG: nitrite reductase [Deltaproteobacteria bacterium RIFCSPLOWO2_02_FULL_55_12]OIJ73392.1 MAG: nitrite reductase [Deltaproteobacteria bacterium GWC2_55_46]HBG47253.1 nitrite reductase [Deltaproteobacteria bacterium]HCY10019.1 nitrite reductase [Deltaproteobacteria bacterium]
MVNKLSLLSILLAVVLLSAAGAAYSQEAALSEENFAKAKQIYFDRCAGCHGTLRKGATGPNLEPAKTRAIPTASLSLIIAEGTKGGMPPHKDILTKEEIDMVAAYMHSDPPQPPEWGMEQIKDSWKLIVPVDKRPTQPPKRNWLNYFGVIQRDIGKVSIIDGDTKEILASINTGFAVHILRTSASGRYMFSIGRDGKATMIDLWSPTPNIVAEIKTGFDARSVDTSKYKGKLGDFTDKYAVVGNYWPPHYVILKGDTLEPLKVVSTRSYTYDTNEFHPEPRVASIVSSHHAPEWVLNIKETGIVLLVDYSKVDSGTVIETKINAERFLHDGGWDASKRYFLVAANMRNKVAVIDTVERKLAALVETGNKPHPGRGANWVDSKYGPVWATPHLGEPMVAVIGTDPAKHKEHAWKVVRKLPVSGNGLFIKTHPKSDNIWVDNTLSKDLTIAQTVTVYSKKNLDAKPVDMKLTDHGKIVHMEYNKAGDEVWLSVWDREGEIIVIDDKTRKVKNRIKVDTPTGKFNVYNTMWDIY